MVIHAAKAKTQRRATLMVSHGITQDQKSRSIVENESSEVGSLLPDIARKVW